MTLLAYAPTAADVDWLACELETALTVVVTPPRAAMACYPSCGDSNVRDLGGYFECASCGYGWG
jgi:hypothetical protein